MAGHIWGNVPIGPESEGELTNPADDALVADSGAVTSGGIYEVLATVGASAAAEFQLQRRNTANDANVGDVVILKAAASQTAQYRFWFTVLVGERVRIVMDDALGAGTAYGSVNLMQMA